jgi:mannosyltransferase
MLGGTGSNSGISTPMSDRSLHGGPSAELEVLVPNLNWRYSGVTAVNRTMAPLLAERCRVAWLGPYRPGNIAPLGFRRMLQLRFGRSASRSIWHARRNVEMIVGLALKWLGFPFALVFTSAAQRHHTWITRFLIARMDAVIATSEAAACYLKRRATVIPHGIDTRAYHPPADRPVAFAATGLPGKYAVGAFGRVRPQKGTDVFVDAMCRLLPRYPQWSAVVVGRTTVEHRAFVDNMQAKIAEVGLTDRVRFLGEVPIEEVPRWYQRISIYAFTSREEGFGLTLLEAMAAGTALVAARAGVAEMVVKDGETGVLVPPGDVAALVGALEPLMHDPDRAAEMGQRARARAVAAFSLQTEAERIVDVYRQMSRPAESAT